MAGFGLRLARSQGMEGFTGNLFEFNISPTNADAIYTGDPVALSGGFLVASTTAAAAFLGVFMGCRYEDSNGDYKFERYWDGGANRTNVKAHVAMPSHGMFYIKGTAGVDFQPATSVGAAHPFTFVAGDPRYGDSRTTLAGPAAGPVIVHRLADLPGNAWGTGEPILEVSANLQQGTFADAS